MPDWEYKDRPDAFCNVPLDVVAARIGDLIETYRPQVVISYDDKGMYQHPDHVHAAQAAAAAAAQSGIPAKYYQAAMRGSDWRKVWEALRELGADVPDQREFTPEQQRQMEEAEQRITTTLTSGRYWDASAKPCSRTPARSRIRGSASCPPRLPSPAFGRESFVRVTDTTGAALPEDDLFAGLR